MADGIERRRVYSVQLFSHPVTCSTQAEQSSESGMTLKTAAFTTLLSPVRTHHHEPYHPSGLSSSTTHQTSQQCPIATSSTFICSHTLLPSRLADNGFLLLHLFWLSARLSSSLWEMSTPWMKVMEVTDRQTTGYDFGLWLRSQIMRKILFTETGPWPVSHSVVFKRLAVCSGCWSSPKAPADFPALSTTDADRLK